MGLRLLLSPLSLVLVILIAAGTAWFVSRQSGPSGKDFSAETAQVSFLSYATKTTAMRRLQLAQVQQMEVFERKSEARIFWDTLKLPDVVVSASVPVEYNYYVSLENFWAFNIEGDTLKVSAPPLLAGTPAPNISEVRFAVKEGSMFRNSREVAQKLRAEITSLLHKRAEENTSLIRETARKELHTLAQAWLAHEGLDLKIEIHFQDEAVDSEKR